MSLKIKKNEAKGRVNKGAARKTRSKPSSPLTNRPNLVEHLLNVCQVDPPKVKVQPEATPSERKIADLLTEAMQNKCSKNPRKQKEVDKDDDTLLNPEEMEEMRPKRRPRRALAPKLEDEGSKRSKKTKNTNPSRRNRQRISVSNVEFVANTVDMEDQPTKNKQGSQSADAVSNVMRKRKKVEVCRNSTNHPGFKNTGIICFIISSIQFLMASTHFLNFFKDLPSDDVEEFKDLHALMRIARRISGREKVSRAELDKLIRGFGHLSVDEFGMDGASHQDPAEFITMLLPYLADQFGQLGLNHDPSTPFLITTNTVCQQCHKTLTVPDKCIFYNVVPEKNRSVQELIAISLKDERNFECCSQKNTVESRMLELPDNLVVQIARTENGTDARNKVPVEVSTDLVLTCHYDETKIVKNQSYTHGLEETISEVPNEGDESMMQHNIHYELIAVVMHEGTKSDLGHCFCYIYSEFENQWLKCDDQDVTVITKEDLMREVPTRKDAGLQKDCYLLLYKKVRAI
ncbi:uncharacterized protein LOC132194859 [Neocloeon triangulifer]|uniref:uncharacterized protein LOC132194859 n=1 Tax=Neocloeon triangulifer TaxID=2078957 RepID=UPI00286F1191|nr:uncharacterized protein LOC132194859 [Neocloeon triangulifer]